MEFLKELLSEDVYAKVTEELKDKDVKLVNLKNGGYVDVKKYDDAVSDLNTAREELETTRTQITELQKTENLTDELKANLQKLEDDFKVKEAEYQDKLINNRKQAYIDREVLKSGTIDEVSVKAHLQNFLKEAKYEDDKIVGLDEELSKLQEEKAYLWEKPKATGTGHGSPKKDLTEEERVRRAVGLK